MTIQDYLNKIEQKRAGENLSLICLRQRHKDTAKKISKFLQERFPVPSFF